MFIFEIRHGYWLHKKAFLWSDEEFFYNAQNNVM